MGGDAPGALASNGAETGQASAEWLGLLLVAALLLGALATAATRGGGGPAGERSLGELVAGRLVCAARGSCVSREGARGSPLAAAVQPAAAPARARAVDALRRLRSVGAKLVRRAWIVCIGYQRFRFELEHPRPPTEPMPIDEALEIANGCLNPYAFLVEER